MESTHSSSRGELVVEYVSPQDLKANPRNTKKHPQEQIDLLCENIEAFGFTQPILCDEQDRVLAGHGRLLAAIQSRLPKVPAIRLVGLSEAQKRAVAIADNKIAERGEYDLELLKEELEFLFNPETDLDFDPRILGFETVEVDNILLSDDDDNESGDPDDLVDVAVGPAITELGDVWICDCHKVCCGDARVEGPYLNVMDGELADAAFVDFPFNVPNSGHVTGRAGVREFPMAHGEMTDEQFRNFLSDGIAQIKRFSVEAACMYFVMDWRHSADLELAAMPHLGRLKNLIVWTKINAGLGSGYRSQHELIHFYQTPTREISGSLKLGARGRKNRSNVWRYPGCNSFGRDRDSSLAMHPTVKPVAMIADALRDCTKRDSVVLDPFGGSGSTLVAAERTGRRAKLIELDPLYCDTIVRRWQTMTGKLARHATTGKTFQEAEADRRAANARGVRNG